VLSQVINLLTWLFESFNPYLEIISIGRLPFLSVICLSFSTKHGDRDFIYEAVKNFDDL